MSRTLRPSEGAEDCLCLTSEYMGFWVREGWTTYSGVEVEIRRLRVPLRDRLSRFAERMIMAKGLDRARWTFAYWLNIRYQDMCWSRLVNWALGYEDWWFPLEARGTAGQCERDGGIPYCGKCLGERHRRKEGTWAQVKKSATARFGTPSTGCAQMAGATRGA